MTDADRGSGTFDAPAGPWTPPPLQPGVAPPAMGRSQGLARALTPANLVGPIVTLAVAWLFALVFFATADPPGEYIGDVYVRMAALLVVLVVPVALLVAWGEVDLSVFGTVALAGWVYSETADVGVVVGLGACAAVGLAAGLAIGVARWVTRAPSAVLSLGAGFLLQAVGVKLLDADTRGIAIPDGAIDGNGLPVLAALAVTGLACVAAVLGLGAVDAEPEGRGSPRPVVIVGFALSGLAAGVYGGLLAGVQQFVGSFTTERLLLTLFAAVAVAGIVRGNSLLAPLAGAAGALAVALIQSGANLRRWESFTQFLLVSAFLVGGALVGHGLHRVLDAVGGLGGGRGPLPAPITAPTAAGAPPPGTQPLPPPPPPPAPPPQPSG